MWGRVDLRLSNQAHLDAMLVPRVSGGGSLGVSPDLFGPHLSHLSTQAWYEGGPSHATAHALITTRSLQLHPHVTGETNGLREAKQLGHTRKGQTRVHLVPQPKGLTCLFGENPRCWSPTFCVFPYWSSLLLLVVGVHATPLPTPLTRAAQFHSQKPFCGQYHDAKE